MGCPRPNTPRSDPHDWGQLANPLRDQLWTMCGDYGLDPVSLYRDPGRQWDLRHDRVPGHECDPSVHAHPPTAVPATWNGTAWVGGSKHQHRQAGDVGGSRLLEALAVCAEYGLCAPVDGEAWHYETDPLIRPIRPIRAYPGPTYDNPDLKDWFAMATEADLARIVNAALEAKLEPIRANVAQLHAQLIGAQTGAKPEALRQLLRVLDTRTDEIVRDTRELTGGR